MVGCTEGDETVELDEDGGGGGLLISAGPTESAS